MDYFGWKQVAIVYDIEDVFFRIQGLALNSALKNDDKYKRPFDIEYDSKKNPDFDDILVEASKHARSMFENHFRFSNSTTYLIENYDNS